MSNYFYRNPRLAILLIGLIVVAGISSSYVLPRIEDPILTERFALVNTLYPGADAERVEALVTEPLEEALREIEEIKEVRSISRGEISTINIELADSVYEVDEVWSRVRDKLSDARFEFPAGTGDPDFRRVDMKAYALIVALCWTQDEEPNYAVLRRQAEVLEDRLLGLPGTEKVRIFGDPEEEYVVTIRPEKLALLGLTASDVAARIGQSDAKVSAGLVRSSRTDLLLEVSGELDSLTRIARTPIVMGDDSAVVRLEDVAEIRKGIVEPPRSLAIVDGRPAIALGVLVRDRQRLDRWTRDAEDATRDFAAQLPRGVQLSEVFSQETYVSGRLRALLVNLMLGAAGVMLVVLVTMGWRSAVIVCLALPVTALMVLTGLRLLDVPIHQMSVTGLIIALGLLIDNAIVMVDEVSAKLREGTPPARAVSQTVRHLSVPLLGSTVTTALAFAPLALMPGPAGEFVGSIGVSVILAIFSSLFLALTLVSAATAWGAAGTETGRPSWWRQGWSADGLARRYVALLDFVLRRPVVGVACGLLVPMAGFATFAQLPEQFFPPSDRDQFQIELELPAQASLAQTQQLVTEIREHVLQHPHVERVNWFLGESAPSFYYNVIPRRQNTAGYAQALVQASDASSTRETIHQLQAELDGLFPQTRLLVRQLEQGPPFDAPIEIRLFGADLQRLRDLGDQVRGRLAGIPEVVHTRADLAETVPKLVLRVDEEQARRVGLDNEAIARQLQSALEGAVRGSVLESTEELPVRVRLPNQSRGDLGRIVSLDLRAAATPGRGAARIPLSALAQVDLFPETSAIARLNGERMNEVKAYISAGVLPAKVLRPLLDELARDPLDLPPGYRLSVGGESEKRNDAVGNLFASVGVLVVLMVATLVMSFRSFRMAGIIGVVAGLSLGLGLFALWVSGYPFGFMAIVGSMGLMGVAINDAIVVLAAIRAEPSAAAGDAVAIRNVVLHTTRHVVATTFTTIAGFLPLVIAGGEFWPPLAVAISGGVGGATLLALLFVPGAYALLMCPRACGQTQAQKVVANAEKGKAALFHSQVGAVCHPEGARALMASRWGGGRD